MNRIKAAFPHLVIAPTSRSIPKLQHYPLVGQYEKSK